jgi:tetratricopeptide (TPR) repeat protein
MGSRLVTAAHKRMRRFMHRMIFGMFIAAFPVVLLSSARAGDQTSCSVWSGSIDGPFKTCPLVSARTPHMLTLAQRRAEEQIAAGPSARPKDAPAGRDAATCAAKDGPADAGIAACGRVIASAKGNAEHLNALVNRAARYADDKKDLDKAMTDLDDAVQIASLMRNGSLTAIVLIMRAGIYYKKGDIRSAITDLEQALQLDPNNNDASKLHQYFVDQQASASRDGDLCEYQRGPTDEVIAACGRLIGSGKMSGNDLATLFYKRGFAFAEKADYDHALADLSEALRLDPSNALALHERAQIFAKLGDQSHAIADYDTALHLDPGDRSAYWERGTVYRQKGDYDRAIADFSEVIRLDPSDADAFVSRGNVYRLKDDFDHATADFDEASRLDANSAGASTGRGAVYFAKGQHDRAIAELDKAIRLGINHPSSGAYFFRGFAYLGKGAYDGAISDLSESIKLEPNYYAAYQARALAYEANGELERALADYGKVLSLNPQDKDTIDKLQRIEANLQAKREGAVAGHQSAAVPKKRVALVVGNGAYRFATPLTNPVNDALDFAGALRKLGFEVVAGTDLDRRGIDEKIREFSRRVADADLALFFYAGHGVQVAGKNYLVPVDATLERASDLALDAVDIGVVLNQMEADNRVNLIFLDACRDNPFVRSLARSMGTRSASVGRGLAAIEGGIGTMIAYSTQPDNVAFDGEGRNSPFTTALLNHIGDRGIEIGMIMRRVRAQVIVATNQKQVPWDHSSLIGEIYLAR